MSKIKEFKLTNTINLCTEGATHKFHGDYNAKAFPRYILIDDKGYILDATAGKPSMVKEELEQLNLDDNELTYTKPFIKNSDSEKYPITSKEFDNYIITGIKNIDDIKF